METIDDIMDNFDFDKVHEAMTLLGWRWVNHDTKAFEIPHVSELRKRARRLMQDAMGSHMPSYATGTGGFEVDKETIEGKVYLSLSFVLTSWNNYA